MKKISKYLCIIFVIVIMIALATTLVACKEEVSLEGLKFTEDGELSWNLDSIVGAAADSYQVFVDGVEKKINLSSDGGKVGLNILEDIGNKVKRKVEIKAKGDKVKIDQEFTFVKLPDLTVEIKNGCFDWSASATQYGSYGSIIYDIIVDGERIASTTETFHKATTGVGHTISVRPRVFGTAALYFSSWSQEVSTTVLTTPVVSTCNFDIQRDAQGTATSAKATVNWTAANVSGDNVSYVLTLNGIEYTTDATTLDTSTIAGLDVTNGLIITTQAVCDLATISNSAESAPQKFISLADVKNVRVEDGIIKFDAVDNAVKYCVNINGEKTYTDTNYLSRLHLLKSVLLS